MSHILLQHIQTNTLFFLSLSIILRYNSKKKKQRIKVEKKKKIEETKQSVSHIFKTLQLQVIVGE